ncbi:hypothetical protein GP486_008880, partial [Trichoglossum hirsutum]
IEVFVMTPAAVKLDLKVADAVWVAAAMLHRANPRRVGFTVAEIVEKVKAEGLTEGKDVSIYTHVNQHCVSNRPPNDAKLRMLDELDGDLRRLHCPNEPSHPARNGRFCPEPKDLSYELLPLLGWYEEWCQKQATRAREEDPLLELAGTGSGRWERDAVSYVSRLREE